MAETFIPIANCRPQRKDLQTILAGEPGQGEAMMAAFALEDSALPALGGGHRRFRFLPGAIPRPLDQHRGMAGAGGGRALRWAFGLGGGRVTAMDKVKVSRAVRGLLARGLLVREEDAVDRRVQRLAMTPAGQGIHGRIVPRRAGWRRSCWPGWRRRIARRCTGCWMRWMRGWRRWGRARGPRGRTSGTQPQVDDAGVLSRRHWRPMAGAIPDRLGWPACLWRIPCRVACCWPPCSVRWPGSGRSAPRPMTRPFGG